MKKRLIVSLVYDSFTSAGLADLAIRLRSQCALLVGIAEVEERFSPFILTKGSVLADFTVFGSDSGHPAYLIVDWLTGMLYQQQFKSFFF